MKKNLNRDTTPLKKDKKQLPFFHPELFAFVVFLAMIGLLVLMAILPSASKKKSPVLDKEKITNPPLLLKEPDPEKKEQRPENLPFPEEESDWIPLVKKHLWRIVYGNSPQIIQESKLYLQGVPKEAVANYIQSLLKSDVPLDPILGAVGVQYIEIPSLVSDVVQRIPVLFEEKNVEGVSFYLGALGLGGKSEIPILSQYAFQSQILRNRLVALESLARIKVPSLVASLCDVLKKQSKSTPESVAIIQTIIASVQKEQYSLITNLFDSPLTYPKDSALFIMKTVDLDGFVEFYEKALFEESPALRKRAYTCLMELKSSHSVPLLLERAQNKNLQRWEQILALEALGRCGSELNGKQLDPFLQSKDPIFRFVACSILANLKDPRGISGLIALLSISENEIEVPQGSDMEEEQTWLKEQTLLVLEQVTQKEFPDAVSWNNWWLKQQGSFKFPSFSYMEKPPLLYENR